MSVVKANTAESMPGTVVSGTSGTTSTSSTATSRPTADSIARRSSAWSPIVRKHELGFGVRRDYVRCHAAVDEPDAVEGPPSTGSSGQCTPRSAISASRSLSIADSRVRAGSSAPRDRWP
jgi:hypothetical protein